MSPLVDRGQSVSIKTTFCLIDWYQLEGNSNTKERIYWECQTSFQGIAPGWVDQYHQSLEGQKVDITGAKPGLFYLVSTANPERRFLETDYTNNTAWTSFKLTRDSSGNPKIEVAGNSACETPGLCGVGAPNCERRGGFGPLSAFRAPSLSGFRRRGSPWRCRARACNRR